MSDRDRVENEFRTNLKGKNEFKTKERIENEKTNLKRKNEFKTKKTNLKQKNEFEMKKRI